jgi:hypothetical protein
MSQAASRRPPSAEARVRSRVSPLGFVMDKVALGQAFPPAYFGFPLSISFHRCSINCKKMVIFLFIFITKVAQEALRLRCVRSICCGALLHKTKLHIFAQTVHIVSTSTSRELQSLHQHSVQQAIKTVNTMSWLGVVYSSTAVPQASVRWPAAVRKTQNTRGVLCQQQLNLC